MRLILSAICFLLFFSAKAQSWDYEILKHLYGKDRPIWDKSMRITSQTVYLAMPLAVGIPLADGLYNHSTEQLHNALNSALCIGLAEGLSLAAKYAVKRTRPYHKYPGTFTARDHPGTYSFPSGHSTAAFASATALTLSYKKWQVAVPAYAYAALVGYSRMRLGVHYPSDVLGGMVIGIGAGFLTWKIDQLIRK